jgi:Nickel-containing superoxide dismutase
MMILRTAATKIARGSNVSQRAVFSTAATLRAASTTAPTRAAGVVVAAVAASLLLSHQKTYNHCQVPCGIFDDPAMVGEVKQAATTIRKSMVQSQALWRDQNKGIQSMNQVVRWIITKEQHCDKIISIIGDYCLCQRVKRESFKSEAEYNQALQLHHTAMQAAMKAKQSMDLKACDDLDHALEDLGKMYS